MKNETQVAKKRGRKPGKNGVARTFYLSKIASDAIDAVATLTDTSVSKLFSQIAVDAYTCIQQSPKEEPVMHITVTLDRPKKTLNDLCPQSKGA